MIERLLLVDLGAIYWHAWHSSNSDSAPDASAEATLSRVRRWASEYRWVAICLDDPAGTFRHQLYPAYKSTRAEKPEGATAQLRRTIELLRRDGFTCWQAANHEADDVIASATALAVDAGISVTIASRDKDLHSLVQGFDDGHSSGPSVVILDYTTGNTRNRAAVQAKYYGISPEQIVDWLALCGDASDNVPGCPGVGEKGAAEMLAKHGDITGLYKWLEKAAKVHPDVHTMTAAVAAGLVAIGSGKEPTKQAGAKLVASVWAYQDGGKWALTEQGTTMHMHVQAVTRERESGRWITPAVQKALLEARETVELSRRLVTLVDVLPIPVAELVAGERECPACKGHGFLQLCDSDGNVYEETCDHPQCTAAVDPRGTFVELGDTIPEPQNNVKLQTATELLTELDARYGLPDEPEHGLPEPIPSKPISPADMARLKMALAGMVNEQTFAVFVPPTPTPQPAPEDPKPPPSPPVQPGRLETVMANDNAVATPTANGAAKPKQAAAPTRPRLMVAKGLPHSTHATIVTGDSGIGKTHFCSTIPGRFWIATEDGLKGASSEHAADIEAFRSETGKLLYPQTLADLIYQIEEFALIAKERTEPTQYRHLVVDSMTGIERLVHIHTCKRESVEHMDGKEFGETYKRSKPHWYAVRAALDKVRAAGAHVWLVAHTVDAKQTIKETGDQYVKADLALQGTGPSLAELRGLWRQWADNVLFIGWSEWTSLAKSKKVVAHYDARIFYTRDTPQRYAKNRCNLPVTLPATWADLSRAMKAGAPAPAERLKRDIDAITPQLTDEQQAEIAADTEAAKTPAALAAVLSRAQGMAATNEQPDVPAQDEQGNDDGKDAAE